MCAHCLISMAGKEIMKIAYGIDVQDKNDPYILTAEHAVGSISATTNAGSNLVDTLPFCESICAYCDRYLVDTKCALLEVKYIPEWFPGARFQTEARLWKASVDRMRDAPFKVVKELMVRPDSRPIFTTRLTTRHVGGRASA